VDRFVTIASFYSPVTANLFKLRLAENGIQAGSVGEGTIAAGSRIEVQVSEWDAEKAARILEEFETEGRDHSDEDDIPEGDGFPSKDEELQSDAFRPERYPRDDATEIRPAVSTTVSRQQLAEPDSIPAEPPPSIADAVYPQCPSCKTSVDAGRETCHWCGASMKAVPEPADTEPTHDEHPIVDAGVLRDIETSVGDRRSRRALMLSVYGLLIGLLVAAGMIMLVSGLSFLLWSVVPSAGLVLAPVLVPALGLAWIFLPPICHIISFVNVVRIVFGDYKLSARGKGELGAALILDLLVFAAWFGTIWSITWQHMLAD
jgi:hypothetical protein